MTAVLLFDGDCAFCSTSARLLQRWVRPTCFVVAYQRVDLPHWHVDEQRAASEVLLAQRGEDGVVVLGGAAAIAAALRSGRQPWPAVGHMLDAPGVRRCADLSYRWVARHRHQLPGGTPACVLDTAVPAPAMDR